MAGDKQNSTHLLRSRGSPRRLRPARTSNRQPALPEGAFPHARRTHTPRAGRPCDAWSRRGEGAIIANLIIFVAVMGFATATVLIFKALMDDTTNASAEEVDRTVSVMRTDFAISTASYSSGTIYVYAKNTGQEQLDPDDLDVYLDDIRIPRNTTNRTIQVAADTDTINTAIWDTKEEVELAVFTTYSVPETHTITIVAPNGVKAETTFSS